MTDSANVLAPYTARVLNELHRLLDELDFAHIELLRSQLSVVEARHAHDFDAAALSLMASEALGIEPTRALPVASALGLLTLTMDVARELAATRVEPVAQLERDWGVPRTLNAADAFYVLSQQALLRLSEHGLSPEDVMKASAVIRTATLGLCEDLLVPGDSAPGQPARAALVLAMLLAGAADVDAGSTLVQAGEAAIQHSSRRDEAAGARLRSVLEALMKERPGMKKTVKDIDVQDKRVLVRVDFNVPFDKDGGIADDMRIRAAIPTINYLQERGAKVILCSHLGRPDGKVVESLRLTPVAARLSELLGQDVQTTDDCVGPEVEAAAKSLQPGAVLLLENLRFHPEEEANDAMFAKQLASLAEVYVNDAFGTAHRAHASTAGVASYLPAVAGFLMAKEVEELGNILGDPKRPLAAILGGAKISSKVAVLTNLLPRIDYLMLGGGIASTFLKAQGMDVADSLVEDDFIVTANEVMREADTRGIPVLLPVDAVVADKFGAEAAHQTVAVDMIPTGGRIMDVGPETIGVFKKALDDCGTVFWNGPLGVAEFPAFAEGSLAMARLLADLDASVIIGGGETSALVEQSGLHESYTHVSTGGGASLEFIEGRVLPGVAALQDV